MDNENKDWFKSTFEKSKEGVVKFTRISRLRIEIASIKNKSEERFAALGKKAFQLLKDNEISHDFLSEDFEAIKKLDDKLVELENQIEELKKREEESFSRDFLNNSNFVKTDSNRDTSSAQEEAPKKDADETNENKEES